jgi:hypothetical protein
MWTMNPEHPVYIISKGRAESRLTGRALDTMNVPYHVVVEPHEHDLYAQHYPADKILTLPFDNLGQGSIPARNWVWNHSVEQGASHHWILDDNISRFSRLNRNLQVYVDSGTIFKAAEDFVGRYDNVAISGFQYDHFARAKRREAAFRINTRIYSCILIRNDIPYRWRGRYNEDTDLCLRALKDGWCTVLFYAFTQSKATTMTMKGGNTDQLYSDDGRLLMAESLRDQHPDIVDVKRKFGRWQHHVDYSGFKQKLRYREGTVVPRGVNNYGMKLVPAEVG